MTAAMLTSRSLPANAPRCIRTSQPNSAGHGFATLPRSPSWLPLSGSPFGSCCPSSSARSFSPSSSTAPSTTTISSRPTIHST
ncbi:hypothetical protein CGCVW01_v013744 [Colletotrichum viniferum]|nr:hypothetical protein CGCVW01_v013744 [Colletotrichum viniferum]